MNFCAIAKKAILDQHVQVVLMVSMETHLNLVTSVRDVFAVVILIPASMEAATLLQDIASNVPMLQ